MLSKDARSSLQERYDHLTKAADVIRKPKNWCVGKRDDRQGAYCALGALDKVRGGLMDHQYEPIVKDLAANIPVPVTSLRQDKYNGNYPREEDYQREPASAVARYNNVSTHAQVIAWFDKTAAGMKCLLDADDKERADG